MDYFGHAVSVLRSRFDKGPPGRHRCAGLSKNARESEGGLPREALDRATGARRKPRNAMPAARDDTSLTSGVLRWLRDRLHRVTLSRAGDHAYAAAVSGAIAQGEVEHDGEAAAVGIVHGQVAAITTRQASHDCQSQAAMRIAAASGIDPHEGPERTREMGFGHALAMIAHAQAVMPVMARRGNAKRWRTVGERVFHEV